MTFASARDAESAKFHVFLPTALPADRAPWDRVGEREGKRNGGGWVEGEGGKRRREKRKDTFGRIADGLDAFGVITHCTHFLG